MENKQKPPNKSCNLANITLLIVSTLFSVLLLEIAVRIISPSIFHKDIWLRPNLRLTLKVDIEGLSPIMRHTTNRLGFRGDPIPPNPQDYYQIMTSGGSTTHCYFLDDQKTWSYLLQGKIGTAAGKKVLVQNAGLAGHSTRGHLLMMQTVIPQYKPDMLIFLVGANDLWRSLITDWQYKGSPYEMTSKYYNIFAASRLIQIIYAWKNLLTGQVVSLQKAETDERLRLKKMTSAESSLPENLEEVLVSLPEFTANLNEIIRLGKKNNIKMLFLTQPCLFEDNEYWAAYEGYTAWIVNQKYNLSARTYAKMLNVFNKKLLAVCAQNGVPCFDLANKIPHSQEYLYDQFHYTEKGSALVAASLADFLKTANIF